MNHMNYALIQISNKYLSLAYALSFINQTVKYNYRKTVVGTSIR